MPSRRTTYSPRARESRNAILAKKNAILLLTLASGLFVIMLKLLGAVLWIIKSVISLFVKMVVRTAGLPVYGAFKMAALKAKRANAYIKEQFGENFSRNAIIYGGLVLALFFVTASNIKARELRPEEVGRNSSLYSLLAQQSDFELLVKEEGIQPTRESLERALSKIGVESTIEPTGQMPDEIDANVITSAGDALLKPNITSTGITPKPRDGIITYVVQDGDTISQIAEDFNISTNTILWENKIGPRDFIKPSQELVILPVTGATHTINRGDTLNSIASTYKAKPDDILEVNKLADASELKIGAKIVVPDGIPPAPVVPASYSSGLADIRSIFKPAQPIAGKLNWPATGKRITQYFRGWRHSGIDIASSKGQPIYASDDGVVITSGWNRSGYGYYVIIDHGGGIHTLYAHNSENYVKVGARVKKGDVIAAIGSTGRSTGPHLHFEVRVSGNRVNPLDYL